ncbi:putative cytochrome P450 308a1 [Lucilia cuprina]|uniref:Putative cytochrome P450 308a1 n=1 Tax=Lucilia cuprina TaxID=7375 RepID=A0A0L0CIF7_LUCCU|nr:putative cytochrome P450 308a1 [Lucilia cuprina]
MFSVFFLIFVITVIILFSYLAWKCTYWQRHGVKGPLGVPIVGNMLKYVMSRQHYGDLYQNIYNEYHDLPYIGIYRLFNEPCILLRSSEMLKEVMIRSFQHFQDNVLWVDPKRDVVAMCNPFIAKGEKWRKMRNEIVPIFTPNKVKSSFPHIENVCKKLTAYVLDNINTNCFEAKDLFSKYTLDVVASAAYGLDAQSFTNKNSDFTQLVEKLFLPNPLSLLETTALLFSPTLGKLIKYTYIPDGVAMWLKTIIKNILKLRLNNDNGNTKDHMDFIQWLIENKQKLNEPIDPVTIVGHCSTFLLEGFETSSSLMAFAMYEYATNPLEQQKVLWEIDEVLKRYNGQISYDALQEMTYFEASLYETLRLHPPMMALLKHCTKSFKLPPQTVNGSSFKVPEGMVFIVPVKAVHYDPVLYPDPLAFKPERFLVDKENRPSCSFLGFGEGPRMCPGGRFAMAQTKAGLVSLLSQFTVHLPENAQHKPLVMSTTTFLTAAENGIWIKFKPRT